MPRTRIRGGTKLTVSTGGSQTGDGTNPVGSSLTTDSIGSIDVVLAETATTPVDSPTFALTVASSEASPVPEETSQFFVIMQAQGDVLATPADADSGVALVGATTATASNTAGNGWTNPANAQGQMDNVNATMTGSTGLNPPQQTGVLTLAFHDVGAPVGATLGDLVIDTAMTVAALGGTGSMVIATSIDGGSNYTNRFSSTAAYTGPLTLTAAQLGLTLANLPLLRVRLTTSVRGTTLGTSTATADAAVLTINL